MQRVVIEPCAGLSREPSIAHEDQHARDDDQRDESNQSIEENGEKTSRLLIRSLLPEQVSLDDIINIRPVSLADYKMTMQLLTDRSQQINAAR